MVPPWIVKRLACLDLNHALLTTYFQHGSHENTPIAKAVLVKADQVAGAFGLDDEGIDGSVVGLVLE
jgi:hypothetical protein